MKTGLSVAAIIAVMMLASCSRKPAETPNYLGPNATGAKAATTAPRRPMEHRVDLDRDANKKVRWLGVESPEGTKALLGTESFGITAMVDIPSDPAHFLVVLYKGSCKVGWQPYRNAGVLNKFGSPDSKAREEATPSIPWVESNLANTCKADPGVSTIVLTKQEAVTFMMGQKD